MNDLPLEKQFTHHSFCNLVDQVDNVEFLKSQLRQLHLLYLRQQVMVAQITKGGLSLSQNTYSTIKYS